MSIKILAFAGSLRHGSWNKKLIRIASEEARTLTAEVTLIDLLDYPLPIFDEDLESEEGLPVNARKLKDLFLSHDALMIASPEYNSSISGVLKNTIDWVSRPSPGEGSLQCFAGKTCGLFSASPGALGGLRGLVTLRSILSNIRVLVLPDQFALSRASEAFDDSGKLKDAKTHSLVQGVVRELVSVSSKLSSGRKG